MPHSDEFNKIHQSKVEHLARRATVTINVYRIEMPTIYGQSIIQYLETIKNQTSVTKHNYHALAGQYIIYALPKSPAVPMNNKMHRITRLSSIV